MTSKLDKSQPSESRFLALIRWQITENGHIKLCTDIDRNKATNA